MNLAGTDDTAHLRKEAQAWLASQHPGIEPTDEDDAFRFRRSWQAKLNDAGWLGLTWPQEFGGRGLSPLATAAFSEELAASRAPRPANLIGLEMSGPTILSHGTEEQKARLLPPLLSGAEIWCQGFSEPGSGSDLVSLRTRASFDGMSWRITGQKIWTSFAHEAKWCMLLARTNPDAPGHQGLTCFLLDMEQPGVKVRRIRQITGDAEFNEIFMDDAVASPADVLGVEGEGWRVAITTLLHERANLAIALAVDVRVALDNLIDLIRERAVTVSQVALDKLAYLAAESEILRRTSVRTVLDQVDGLAPGADSALGKWRWAAVNQGLNELALDVLGIEQSAPWQKSYLRSRANTIEGGTSEILKNIVAERVLHLPKSK